MTNLKGIDQEDAWGMGAGPPPPGRHDMLIFDVELTEKNDQEKWILSLEVVNSDHAGCSMRDWVTINPKTLGMVRSILEGAGVEIESGDWEFDPMILKGRTVGVMVARERANDGSTNDDGTPKMYSNVKGYGLPRGPRASANGTTSGPDEDPFVSQAAPGDDDIPF